MTDFVVTIADETLSDGSKVHNLVIRDLRNSVSAEIPAITFQDAYDCAEKIIDAINEHTALRAEWR